MESRRPTASCRGSRSHTSAGGDSRALNPSQHGPATSTTARDRRGAQGGPLELGEAGVNGLVAGDPIGNLAAALADENGCIGKTAVAAKITSRVQGLGAARVPWHQRGPRSHPTLSHWPMGRCAPTASPDYQPDASVVLKGDEPRDRLGDRLEAPLAQFGSPAGFDGVDPEGGGARCAGRRWVRHIDATDRLRLRNRDVRDRLRVGIDPGEDSGLQHEQRLAEIGRAHV